MHGTFKITAIIAAGNGENSGVNFHITVNIQNFIYKTKCTISEVILNRSCFPLKYMAWYASANDYHNIRNGNLFQFTHKVT